MKIYNLKGGPIFGGLTLHDKRVDIIITDLNMPNMDGIELIRALRAQPSYKAVPILILTTEGNNDMKIKGKEAGATGWIVKPFDPEKLIDLINKALPPDDDIIL